MGRSRGLYRAVVDDDQDPLGQGRLRLSVPDVGVAAAWAEACLPPVPLDLLRLPAVGSTEVSGVLKCQTLIADTVIASSYTPGAGNVW